MQDRFGYLWFAHTTGLDRYDGNTFVRDKHDPADRYSTTIARKLSSAKTIEDASGDVARAERFDRTTVVLLSSPSKRHARDGNVVFAVHETVRILWIGTGGGLYVCDRPGDRL
jgi:ligand-binding sensor domain-containing protein